MNILVFAPYYSPHIGGVENYIEEFCLYATTHGHQVTIFAPQIPRDTLEVEDANKITIFRYPAFEVVRNYPIPKWWSLRFWKLLSRIQQNKFDIILSHTRFFFSSFLALLFSKIYRLPWAHIEHGSSSVVLSNSFVSFVSRLSDSTIGKLIFRLSTINIAISKDVQQFIRKFDDRLSPIIHRGIVFDDIDAIRKSTPAQTTSRNVQIVSVGRLTKWKGFQEAMIAVGSLPESAKEMIQYTIVGDGEERTRLELIAKKHPEIHLAGKLPRNEVLKALLDSDIFIHPSIPGGGLATTLLEAMACECAIIATPNEGATDAIENEKNGILIEAVSPKLLRNALLSLLKDKDKVSQLSKKAERDVRDKFSWEVTGKELFRILERVKKS